MGRGTIVARTLTVSGRLASPTSVVLDEAVAGHFDRAVLVTIHSLPASPGTPRLVEVVRAAAPARCSKSELDARLRAERDAWDR